MREYPGICRHPKHRPDDGYPGWSACQMTYDQWADSVTRPVAERMGQPWEPHELAILKDASEGRQGTALETAFLLGRTYGSITTKAVMMGWTRRNPDGSSSAWAPFGADKERV